MTRTDVIKQLCKMQNEVARIFGVESICICERSWVSTIDDKEDIIPDRIIEFMWEAIHTRQKLYLKEEVDKDIQAAVEELFLLE